MISHNANMSRRFLVPELLMHNTFDTKDLVVVCVSIELSWGDGEMSSVDSGAETPGPKAPPN